MSGLSPLHRGDARSSRKPQACGFPAVCDEAGGSFFIMILTDSAFTDTTNEKTPELEKIRPGLHILWSVSSSFVIFVRASGCLAETPCPVSLPVLDS